MKNTDTGPTMPPPDDRKSAHARAVLMAQVRQTPLEPSASTADVATFGRSELDDAPREIKKRWLAAGAGLAAAAVGAAIVLGSGPFGDDLGVTPAEDPNTDSPALESAEGEDPSGESLTSFAQGCVDDANKVIGTGPFAVVVEFDEPEYQLALFQSSSDLVVCVKESYIQWGLATGVRPSDSASSIVELISRQGTQRLGEQNLIADVGRVGDDVQAITVSSPIESEEVSIQDGYYSVVLDAEPTSEITYEVTMRDGTTTTIEDPLAAMLARRQ